MVSKLRNAARQWCRRNGHLCTIFYICAATMLPAAGAGIGGYFLARMSFGQALVQVQLQAADERSRAESLFKDRLAEKDARIAELARQLEQVSSNAAMAAKDAQQAAQTAREVVQRRGPDASPSSQRRGDSP